MRRYQRGLIYLLQRRTRDHALALDLAQDTFHIAIEKLRHGPIEQVDRVAAYLRGTALNLATAEGRKNARRGTTTDSDAVIAAADPPKSAGTFDQVSSEQVQRVVRSCSTSSRGTRPRIWIDLPRRGKSRSVRRSASIPPLQTRPVRAKQPVQGALQRAHTGAARRELMRIGVAGHYT